MIFTDSKIDTLRTATASGRITVSPDVLGMVKEKKVPKGDVLEAARTAGILAAKKTWEILPYCHPIPLDGISIGFKLEEGGIRVESTVKAVWKTGVEMEALTAVAVALLTIFDMLKGIDPKMEIGGIEVSSKKGGKSDFIEKVPNGFRAAVVVTSDGVFEGKRKDESGVRIVERLKGLGIRNVERAIVPDDQEVIKRKLLQFCEEGVSLIVTTGGTGLGPRDVTVEATEEVIERKIPGLSEAMRSHGRRRNPRAVLSRGTAGVRGATVLVNLPGSATAAEESIDAIFPVLFHVYHVLEGGGHGS
ncbi:MAG: bifunctional molybdenum cofactor biosynthesis protein MoaC/MoaB [Pseudomonadota bacterium]